MRKILSPVLSVVFYIAYLLAILIAYKSASVFFFMGGFLTVLLYCFYRFVLKSSFSDFLQSSWYISMMFFLFLFPDILYSR